MIDRPILPISPAAGARRADDVAFGLDAEEIPQPSEEGAWRQALKRELVAVKREADKRHDRDLLRRFRALVAWLWVRRRQRSKAALQRKPEQERKPRD